MITLVEQAVSFDPEDRPDGTTVGRAVKVRREENVVVVAWYCGESRQYLVDDPGGVPALLALLKTAGGFPDVWFTSVDHLGQTTYLRLADGKLQAETRPREGAQSAPWGDLKKAIRKAAS